MNARTIAALVAALATPTLWAQPAPPARTKSAPPAKSTTNPEDWGVRLAADPIHIESIGVSMNIPIGSTSENSVYEKLVTTKIMLPDDLGAVTVQERRSTKLDLDTKTVADDILTQLLKLAPRFGISQDDQESPPPQDATNADIEIVGSSAKVLSRDQEKQIGGYTADHAYVAIPREGTKDYTVRGETLIKVGPGQFLLFELFTSYSTLEKAREMYEVMLATVKIEDPTNAAARRAAEISAGVRIMARLTPDDYREVFENNPERWERLYKAAPTGATSDDKEIGYRRIRARIGHRGDLSPNKPAKDWNEDDKTEGYVVQLDARVLDPMGIIDTRAVYFLSLDLDEEAWVVNSAIRHDPDQLGAPGKVSRWQEIGARDGNDMSINIVPQSSAGTKIRPEIDGEGYISMVQSFMLPQLLVRAGIPADYGFYSYQTTSGTIRFRRDSLNKSTTGRDVWTLTTRLNEDAQPQTTTIGEDGRIIDTTFPDGRRWEPIKLDQLVRLWKTKGLPLD